MYSTCKKNNLKNGLATDWTVMAAQQHSKIDSCLVNLIVSQTHSLGDCLDMQPHLRSRLSAQYHQECQQLVTSLLHSATRFQCSLRRGF